VRGLRRTAAVLGLAAALVASAQPADAAVGDVGHDISHPQCTSSTTTTTPSGASAFGIVGVTNGLPFSVNACLKVQAEWAVGTGQPMLYTNTANPGPSSPNWPTSAVGRCTVLGTTNPGCAYEYGRKAAIDALTKATSALTGSGLDLTKVTWWLDVEGFRQDGQSGNSWEDDQLSNAADVQGFVDGLRQGGVPEVGVYSTSLQWNDITGGYTRAKRSAYTTAWGFAGAFPIEDGPLWFAGVGPETDAQAKCGSASFTGGQRLLAQYRPTPTDLDHDYRCADADLVRPTAWTTSPGTVTQAMSFGAAWSGADSGGSGLATFDVGTRRVASNGASFSAWSYAPALQRTANRSATLTGTGQGWTTCLIARSRDVAGNISAWTTPRCTTVPLDDRALSASSGWTRATGSGWFVSTFSSTTRQYASLTRSGLVTSHLQLIAQRCSTCGKVGVYLGSTLLTTVNLYSSTTGRVVIDLPRFSKRTTSVTLKVLTSGKPVKIDGLVSSQV
jgi:hypothetical protein